MIIIAGFGRRRE